MTGRYYARLGILSTVKDEEEDDEDGKHRNALKIKSGNNSGNIPDDEDDWDAPRKLSKMNGLDEEVETFLKV